MGRVDWVEKIQIGLMCNYDHHVQKCDETPGRTLHTPLPEKYANVKDIIIY